MMRKKHKHVVKPFGKVSDYYKQEGILGRRWIGEDIHVLSEKEEKGVVWKDEQKITFEVIKVNQKLAPFVIIARTEDDTLLGFAEMLFSGGEFEGIADFIEVLDLQVDPGYYQKKLGSNLVLFAQLCAFLRKKKLVVCPGMQYLGPNKSRERVEAPLSTKKLIEMYKRMGFREFRKKEVDELVAKKNEYYLNEKMITTGFNPKTRKWDKKEKNEATPEEIGAMNKLDFETKDRLWRQHTYFVNSHKSRAKHDIAAYESDLAENRIEIKEYLIFDKKIPIHQAKKIRDISKRKDVSWTFIMDE